MTSKLRLALPMVLIGVVGAACFLLLQSHASARVTVNYTHLTKYQKRIISETLSSALGPQSTGVKPHAVIGNGDEGGGPDGAPFTPPKSYGSPVGAGNGATVNYFPSSGSCSANIGNDTKVNQNCLNLTDPSLQGRGQANNEPSISVDPFNSKRLVASDNNYIRGDGTCGSISRRTGGGRGRTRRSQRLYHGHHSRQHWEQRSRDWQAGGDTSVAWDTRGNAYESCQLFNRGTVASANPDQSSTFVLFRATQNGGASWNFPGRYSVPPYSTRRGRRMRSRTRP